MTEYLKNVVDEIQENREEVIEKLIQFSVTDMLLFWGQEKDLIARQERLWSPIIKWSSEAIETKFNTTSSLQVPSQQKNSGEKLRVFLNNLTNKELGAFYVAALNMKSVLLAAALVKGKINANQAFEAAFLEELWQNENWGADEEALKKREELKQELVDVENFL